MRLKIVVVAIAVVGSHVIETQMAAMRSSTNDISDSGVQVTLNLEGRVNILGGFADNVAIRGDYAYVAAMPGGLRIIDISDPSNMREIGAVSTKAHTWDVSISGNYAYLADADGGMRIIDVSNPTVPRQVSAIPSYQQGGANSTTIHILVSGTRAYMVGDFGLWIIDVANPSKPRRLGVLDSTKDGLVLTDLVLLDEYAYVAAGSEIWVVDVSNDAAPRRISTIIACVWRGSRCVDAGIGGWVEDVAVAGDFVYFTGSGLSVLDATNRKAPRKVSFLDYSAPVGGAADVFVADGIAYVAVQRWEGREEGSVRVVDVDIPRSAVEVASADSVEPGWPMGLVLSNGRLYVANHDGGLLVFAVTVTVVPTPAATAGGGVITSTRVRPRPTSTPQMPTATRASTPRPTPIVRSRAYLPVFANLPGCGAAGGTIASRLQVTTVSALPGVQLKSPNSYFSPERPLMLTVAHDGTMRIGWTDVTSRVHVTRLSSSAQRIGPDFTLTGEEIRGLVALDGGVTALIRDGENVDLVRASDQGDVLFKTRIVGGDPKDVVGSKWIDSIHEARLLWNGREYAVYLGHTQLHGDNVAHQGDLLRLYDRDGVKVDSLWEWGCSHSLDVRLAWNGTTLGAVCVSDPFPVKGIAYETGGWMIYSAPGVGNDLFNWIQLGGLVSSGNGFFVNFVSRERRSEGDLGFASIKNDVASSSITWLEDAGAAQITSPHLVRYGSELLVLWAEDAQTFASVINERGRILRSKETLPAQLVPKDDMQVFPDGDVGWAWPSGDSIKVARLSLCDS